MTGIKQEQSVQTVLEMVARNFGDSCCDAFCLEIQPVENREDDFFRISTQGGKVAVTGSDGVALACGVYYYLKQFCHVQFTQRGSHLVMPAVLPLPEQEIYKSTPMKLRYAYNYCTHSYTMPFWGEAEWQRELDFLAFHGVNLVLDITGEEKVWFTFFQKIGYTREQARELLVGPAYWAWFCMANMYGYGGLLPDAYLDKRAELANKNHAFMAKLGMQPVLMGYCGMVPDDIKKIDSSASLIPQGEWNRFRRPAMLKTNRAVYQKYAALFYQAQREILGDVTTYFSTDPFHEGGRRGLLSPKAVAKGILEGLRQENPENVWVIQSWGDNPSKGLLDAVASHKDNVLILDLYAEKRPRYKDFRGKEFQQTPWLYCMLDNFGGRMGLHGHFDSLHQALPEAVNTSSCMKGVGITPEASDTHPMLTEFLFDSIWKDAGTPYRPVDMHAWLSSFLHARYGKKSENAEKCYRILCDTVFNNTCNQAGEGAPESVVNARPGFHIKSVSTWGNCTIGYEPKRLEEAYMLLLKDYELLKESDAYLYDVTDIHKQILSNQAQSLHNEMTQAFDRKDTALFEEKSQAFLALILETDRVLSARPEFELATWLGCARRACEGLDQAAQKMFLQNAKRILTTWGDELQSEQGQLHDYSNRQWSGLTKDLYYKRWKLWIENRTRELKHQPLTAEPYFQMEQQWVEAE